ncbi:MAG TPA: hypothetical protein VFV50_01775 [Bdellovibrionales bacterium]|nr:hypothetical protein [Bdellovibrionales bacterium]
MFYALIESHLRSTRGVTGLEEYFNVQFNVYKDTGTGIARKRRSTETSQVPRAGPGYQEIVERRMRLLENYEGRYFFKVLTQQLTARDLFALADRYTLIFVERRNLFEQFLSWCISIETKVWYADSEVPAPAPMSLQPPKSAAADFGFHIREYAALKQVLRPRHVIVYEDFLERLDPAGLLLSLGLGNVSQPDQLRWTLRQNPADKLTLFREPGRVVSLYRQSALQSLFPVRPYDIAPR